MNAVYVSIEKNVEGFEFYRTIWAKRGISGRMATTMTEGIELVAEIEKKKAESLYFIDIVEDDVDFMPQLEILSEIADAPILIATSKYNEDVHHEALNKGADFYGQYCVEPEKNINAVMAAVNSYQRAKKQKTTENILTSGGILMALSQHKVFVKDISIDLTRQEFDLLKYMMTNRGNLLTYTQIYGTIWGEDYEESSRDVLRNAIKRLRQKLNICPEKKDPIENVLDVGYRFSGDNDK